MKSKILLLPVILLSISLLSTPVQAKKPEVIIVKERTAYWTNSYYFEMLTHSVMVGKSYDMTEDTALVSVSTTIHEHLYDNEGNLVAIAKIQMHYAGTIKGGTGEMWTGKMVIDWIINLMEDLEGIEMPPDLKGHWVIWYEEGISVKEKGFGEPFFF